MAVAILQPITYYYVCSCRDAEACIVEGPLTWCKSGFAARTLSSEVRMASDISGRVDVGGDMGQRGAEDVLDRSMSAAITLDSPVGGGYLYVCSVVNVQAGSMCVEG